MQRVVRSTLAGILTAAALVGCGDKVTVPPQTTTPPDATVHSVTVTPASQTVAVGAKVTFVASVDAGPAAASRTVTWSSSNTAVATVDATGVVTGVAAGTASIIATASADATVKGAGSVTVTSAQSTAPTVTVSSINQTVCGAAGCNSVPANLTNAAGQLDVILNVDSNGQQLKSVSATISCPNNTKMTQTQTISAASADVAAEAAAAPITLSFNTAAFAPIGSTSPAAGTPTLNNGQCSLSATATTNASTPQTATINTGLVINNPDGVLISETFAGYTNAEGVSTKTTANDGGGLPWKGGAVTVSALPVLYSGRSITNGGSLTITLNPNATVPSTTITSPPAGSVTATWSATASSGLRTTGQTLVGAGFEANGTTPLGFTPTVIALDGNGNDLNLVVLNFVQPCVAATNPPCILAQGAPNPTFRLDNTAPEAPTTFIIAGRQGGWAGAAYTFNPNSPTGNASFGAQGTTKYVSCGDGPTTAGGGNGCTAQVGVSNGTVGSSGTNGLTTFTYYAIPFASFTAASTNNGTSTSGTSCATTGWTKITTAGDLAETLNNTSYVVRIFESDALLNARCTDLSAAQLTINTGGGWTVGKFGVDKTPPTAAYVEPAADPTAAANNGALAVGGNIANFNIKIALSDNASGFSSTPVATMVTRLAVNPATGQPSNAGGNYNGGTTGVAFGPSANSTFGCPTGLDSNSNCTLSTSTNVNAYSQTLSATLGNVSLDGTTTAPGCAGCGYYTFSQTPLDLARNPATTVTGTASPTISGASASGASGYRQVVVDQQAPTMGGIAVPATLTGGSSASFATSANDNLDLVSSDFTLRYPVAPTGDPVGNFPIRSAGPALGVAFDNVLTTSGSFNIIAPFFIRSIAPTGAGDIPTTPGLRPDQVTVRVYDAAANAAAPGVAAIAPANVPLTNQTNFVTNVSGGNPAATMINFKVSNAAANISNCPAAGCAGGAAPANATTVTLTATSDGNESTTFQYLNPFSQVQFYYFDPATGEFTLIGSAVAPSVTDNATVTVRTFTWTLSPAFDPPASLGVGAGALKVLAVGVNSVGDGLATAVNANITLTNP